MNGIFDGKSLDYWFNQMYYGTHGPFKRAEAGQAITFENDKVRFEQCFSILLILRRPIGQKFLPMHCDMYYIYSALTFLIIKSRSSKHF